MGYYINNQETLENQGGSKITKPSSLVNFDENYPDHALICQVDNGGFVANALIYSEREFQAFTDPYDRRPKQFYKMGTGLAHKLANYNR